MVLLLLPLVLLASGIIFLVTYATSAERPSPKAMWWGQVVTLALSAVAQIFAEAKNPLVYLHGGLLNDSLNQTFSIFVFVAGLFYVAYRYSDQQKISVNVTILTLAAVFFTEFAIQSNRVFFTCISILGLILTSQTALLNQSPPAHRTNGSISMIRTSFLFLVFSTLVVAMCVLAFGETQLDEIQIFLTRTKGPFDQVNIVQWMILVGISIIAGFIPFLDIFGNSRQRSDWSLSAFFTSLFLIVTLHMFLKDGVFIFTRVTMGAKELEELAGVHLLFALKVVSGFGLLITPVFAILQKNIRKSLLIFMMEPVLQITFALSFGQKEIMAYALGALPNFVLAMGLAGFSLKSLSLKQDSEIRNWIGVGRRNSVLSLMFLASLWALAGYAPFYTGRLIQKTLCISSNFSLLLAVSYFFAGCYALRLSVLAFQKSGDSGDVIVSSPKVESFFATIQFVMLIFMGIFWQPLYKYGAYTIRHLFGEF